MYFYRVDANPSATRQRRHAPATDVRFTRALRGAAQSVI